MARIRRTGSETTPPVDEDEAQEIRRARATIRETYRVESARCFMPLSIGDTERKNRLVGRLFLFWRWGELNPRPMARSRGVYRFSGARWLSGPGGSAASVGSVSWLVSLQSFRPNCQQAPIGVGSSGASEQQRPVSALRRLRGESETVGVIGSYKFCPFGGRATSPAAQAPTSQSKPVHPR